MPDPIRNDIFMVTLDPVVGSEQGGTRPVFVISNNLMNRFAPFVLIIPMTRDKEKVKDAPFNIPFLLSDIALDQASIDELHKQGHHFVSVSGYLLCNQARAISKIRLLGKIGNFINKDTIKKTQMAIEDSFGLTACDKCGIPLRPDGICCGNCGQVYHTKCIDCSSLFSISYNYCPQCGRRAK
jgi:mRNA interferase MazF